MRVISGSRKGHRLKSPKGLDTRPTQDRIKESLFNILGCIGKETMVLDLFAGSGAIGIEFLSRGAKECFFIDNSLESIRVINENLCDLNFKERSNVYKNDVSRAIKILGKRNIEFDYIFMDPPYRRGLVVDILKMICENKSLKDSGVIIIEHECELLLEDALFSLYKVDKRNYGDKVIDFYKLSTND